MKIFGEGSVFPHDPADDPKYNRGAAQFVVSMVYDEESGQYQFDKSFYEIASAIENGSTPILVEETDGTSTIFHLSSYKPDNIILFINCVIDNHCPYMTTYQINFDDSYEYDTLQLEGAMPK